MTECECGQPAVDFIFGHGWTPICAERKQFEVELGAEPDDFKSNDNQPSTTTEGIRT